MPNNRKIKKDRAFRRRCWRQCSKYIRFNVECKKTAESIDRIAQALRDLVSRSNGSLVVRQGGRSHSKGLFINGILIHEGNVNPLKTSTSIKAGVYTVDDPDRPKRKAGFSKTIFIPAGSDQFSPFTNID